MESDIKKAGLKITIPRLKIMEILIAHKHRHLSAEDVYQVLHQSDEEVGLATVYRVLAQFESAGLVSRVQFEGGQSMFELNEGEHHDHILCTQCGKVEEFSNELIEKQQQVIAQQAGFIMTGHCLHIYGLCSNCRKNK